MDGIAYDLDSAIATASATDCHCRAASKRNANSTKRATKKAKKRWEWKKPKGMPKRPLSAYNLFFSYMRMKLKKDTMLRKQMEGEPNCNDSLGFSGLAKTVAAAWKSLDASEKQSFEMEAKIEKMRYKKEIAIWKMKSEIENRTETAPERVDRKKSITGEKLVSQESSKSIVKDLDRSVHDINCVQSFSNLRSQLDEEECTFLISVLRGYSNHGPNDH